MSLSIALIHVIGFTGCAAVATLGFKGLVEDSKKVRLDSEKLEGELPDHKHLVADVFGLGMAMTGYGFDRVEDAADRMFDSRLSSWVKQKFAWLQIRPDGEYFEYRIKQDTWNGYGEAKPKVKVGKFEMEI